MDFFLEIHNGECSLGGHFCDHQRDFKLVIGKCFDWKTKTKAKEKNNDHPKRAIAGSNNQVSQKSHCWH